jgi:hypothetical protein
MIGRENTILSAPRTSRVALPFPPTRSGQSYRRALIPLSLIPLFPVAPKYMKTKTRFQPLILLISFSLILGFQISKAQNALSETRENISIKLSGSDLKSEDIVLKANAVFVGEITELGHPNTKAPGQNVYHGVQIKVLQVLRGSVDAQVTVTLYIHFAPNSSENPPKVGNTYIFFAHKNTEVGWNPFTVLKLLPATDDNIAKVKALIAAAPASK